MARVLTEKSPPLNSTLLTRLRSLLLHVIRNS